MLFDSVNAVWEESVIKPTRFSRIVENEGAGARHQREPNLSRETVFSAAVNGRRENVYS